MTARTSALSRRTAAIAAAGLLPLALTACGAGLQAQTYKERSTQDAANANVGDLALRDVAILPPTGGQQELAAGSDAIVTLTVANQGRDDDRLLSASSPDASSVDLTDSSGHPTQTITVPAQGALSSTDFSLTMRGLTKALRPGTYTTLTLTFDKNGRITFKVPVKLYESPVPRESYSPKSQPE